MTNDNLSNLRATPTAVSAGLLIKRNGEPHLTEAGLFAMAGMLAHAGEADSQTHCQNVFDRILSISRAGGLEALEATVIQKSFAAGNNPADGSEEGAVLAALCGRVARCVGTGRMRALCEGKQTH